ncbi:permease of the major facilitator superfamily [Clostridium sp. SY8519]|uniref:MFS transporter n=1 Tax=Clostridium sp. (strain SY8519) TaxID=1042156 RepID=UPI0002171B47|nr:MFS transporter [Clostridium sp. SY8519]BAK47016.1 permease of the major facilitator superfamily [Clostridium sp. SY8519]
MKDFLKNNNFGKWGWAMIVYAGVSYYIAAALSTDGLNFYPAQFEALHGWNAGLITTMAGIAGWVALAGAVIFAHIIAKIGTRKSAGIINILTGILVLIFANTSNFIVFGIMVFAINFIVANVQLNLIPNNIMNVWFPRKKGMALGWATMGMPICTATVIVILTAWTVKFGSAAVAYSIFGIIIIAFGVLSFFWVKDNPESLGLYPDNEPISKEELEANKKELESHVSEWTMGKLLKNRNTWGIGVGLGLMWMTTVGIVSQLIPRLVSISDGIYAPKALFMLSAAAIIGIAGSYFWGILDTALGTKRACIVYGVWYIAAIVFLLLQPRGLVFVWISVVIVGIGIGGIGNLIPSMIGTCFGRYDFIQANKAIAPLNTIVRQSGIVLAGILSQTVYGYSGLYVVLLIADVAGIFMTVFLIRPKTS